jgi:hypothetical protein
MYIFNNVQNSMESAFNLACSKRWILRLLPISESLASMNNYFSSLKPLISDPAKNSRSTTSNIWLSNFLSKSEVKYRFDNKLYGLNYSELNNSLIDSFESSRNWAQRRSTLTMLPKFSETHLNDTFSNSNFMRRNHTRAPKHINNMLSTLIFSDYPRLMYLDFRYVLNVSDRIEVAQPRLIIYPTLNFWSLFNKNYFVSLWSSDCYHGRHYTSYSSMTYSIGYHI